MGILTFKNEQEEPLKTLKKICSNFYDEANEAQKKRREKWKELYAYWANKKLSEKRPRFKSTTRVNYCWIVTQVKVPVVMAANPTVYFIPYQKDPDHEENGRKLSKVVGSYLYNRLKLREKWENALLDSEIYDAGFLKPTFNPRAEGGKGQIMVSPIDPFKLFVDPLCTQFDNSRFVCHVEIYPVNTLKQKFKKYAGAIKADPTVSDIIYDQRFYDDHKPDFLIVDEKTEYQTERAYLKEFWLAPGEYDSTIKKDDKEVGNNGLIVTMINDQFVGDFKPYDYKHGHPPYVKVISNMVSNQFWGKGDIEQIMPLQDTLNHRIQQLEDIANRCANVGWSVDPQVGKKAIEQLKKHGTKPGLLKIIPPGMLQPDQVPNIPPYLYEEIKQLIVMIERVSGISDILQGRGDVRQRTARGIERLYEAGHGRLSKSVHHYEDSYKELGYQMGSLVKQYYQEERQINIAGDANTARESFTIGSEQLEEEFEIAIDSAAALPQDKQSRAQLVFMLLQNHIFEMALGDDPLMKQAAKVVLDTVEFPNRESLLNFQPEPQGTPGMPEVAPGIPALTPEAQEMAQAGGIPPEQLAQIVQQGMQGGPPPM